MLGDCPAWLAKRSLWYQRSNLSVSTQFSSFIGYGWKNFTTYVYSLQQGGNKNEIFPANLSSSVSPKVGRKGEEPVFCAKRWGLGRAWKCSGRGLFLLCSSAFSSFLLNSAFSKAINKDWQKKVSHLHKPVCAFLHATSEFHKIKKKRLFLLRCMSWGHICSPDYFPFIHLFWMSGLSSAVFVTNGCRYLSCCPFGVCLHGRFGCIGTGE